MLGRIFAQQFMYCGFHDGLDGDTHPDIERAQDRIQPRNNRLKNTSKMRIYPQISADGHDLKNDSDTKGYGPRGFIRTRIS